MRWRTWLSTSSCSFPSVVICVERLMSFGMRCKG
jgi:hypothetical protein